MQELTNSQLAAQLRALADIYEAHPQMPQLYDFTETAPGVFVFCHDKETFAATVKVFGAGTKKNGVGDSINFVPDAFPKLLIASWKEKVCERVVAGTPSLSTEEPAKERENFKDLILDEELYDGAAFV